METKSYFNCTLFLLLHLASLCSSSCLSTTFFSCSFAGSNYVWNVSSGNPATGSLTHLNAAPVIRLYLM